MVPYVDIIGLIVSQFYEKLCYAACERAAPAFHANFNYVTLSIDFALFLLGRFLLSSFEERNAFIFFWVKS